MTHEDAAHCLSELGHPTRLAIYRSLALAGSAGLAVSEIQQRVSVPASTLSHHITRLQQVSLLRQVRQGRVLRCFAEQDRLDHLLSYLTTQCCCHRGCEDSQAGDKRLAASLSAEVE